MCTTCLSGGAAERLPSLFRLNEEDARAMSHAFIGDASVLVVRRESEGLDQLVTGLPRDRDEMMKLLLQHTYLHVPKLTTDNLYPLCHLGRAEGALKEAAQMDRVQNSRGAKFDLSAVRESSRIKVPYGPPYGPPMVPRMDPPMAPGAVLLQARLLANLLGAVWPAARTASLARGVRPRVDHAGSAGRLGGPNPAVALGRLFQTASTRNAPGGAAPSWRRRIRRLPGHAGVPVEVVRGVVYEHSI